MKKIILFLFLTSSIFAYSQCVSGNCYTGFGTMKYAEGTTYQGEFKNSLPNGLGIYFYPNGNYYLGEYKNGKITGKGTFFYKTGENFIGEWLNLKQNGICILRDANGKTTHAGFYIEGVLTTPTNDKTSANNPENCNGNCYDGYGYIQNPDKSYIQALHKDGKAFLGRIASTLSTYDGYISNNLANGYGQIKYTNGDYYFGYFKNGKRHGKGITSDTKNKRTLGDWNGGVLIDKTAFNFKQEDFCNELIALAKLNKEERRKEKVKSGKYNDKILEKTFLNTFEVEYKSSYSSKEILTINFPRKYFQKPTLSMDQLIEATQKCSEFIKDGYNKYKYEGIILEVDYVSNPELKITYPIINPCVSGDCINGYGKKQYHNGVFEGYFQLGERTGYGKMTFDNGKQYEGDYRKDKRHGQGTFTFANGDKIEGTWANHSVNGPGKRYDKDGKIIFEGEYKNGKAVK